MYKIHGSGYSFYGCSFECHYDNTCDFFVWFNSDCHYGQLSYSGSKLINSVDAVYVNLKNGM